MQSSEHKMLKQWLPGLCRASTPVSPLPGMEWAMFDRVPAGCLRLVVQVEMIILE